MKLAAGPAGRAALATYGIRGEPLASVAWAALGAIEAGLAVCLVAGAEGAAWATAAPVHRLLRRPGRGPAAGPRRRAVRLLRGQGPDRPRVDRPRRAAGRRRRRAAAARAPRADHGGVAGARARRRAARRRRARRSACSRWRARSASCGSRSRPQGALEIAGEGPEIGGRTALAEHFGELGADVFGLAVFTSEGCHICQALAPADRALRARPARGRAPLRRARGRRRLGAGRRARAARSRSPSAPTGPCSPRAPSTPAAQLESVLAAAERRRGADAVPEPALSDRVAGGTSRRGFLARVGGGVMALAGREDRRLARQAGRGRGLPLLRPHLHDRLLPAPDRPAADRLARLPAAREGRRAASTTSGGSWTAPATRSTTTASR